MAERATDIAETIAGLGGTGLRLRIGEVTALETTGEHRAHVDVAGASYWASTDADASLRVGERVWCLQQGSVWVVAGRLTGAGGSVPVGALTAYAAPESTIPPGWLLCDGRAVARTDHPALYAVLGERYGAGDGSTTFNLPDLTGRFPRGDSETTTLGQTGGAESTTLTFSNLPEHFHTIPNAGSTTTVAAGTGASVASTAAGQTGLTGTGTAFSRLPPWVAVHYLIRAA